ncbi:uncharacterized protein MONOS_17263 [Monocercomonoides exilis]|uniref:uncharacterized protein n=1 Tax=Monocercomonoides exilis TaxID=2049356 RepID=UPI00355A3021|nr:hypothetical protein MONOS_17263 [Monocercomonoides exilis]
MWAEWACGQWLQGWVVGVWLGWLAGLWCEKKRVKNDWAGHRPSSLSTNLSPQWAGSGLWAVGRAGWVGCALDPGCPDQKIYLFRQTHRLNFTTPRLIAPQGQVSETSRCHRGSRCTLALHNGRNLGMTFKSWKVLDAIGQVAMLLEHANGAVGWACPAGTLWHTFGWWAVAGLRAVPEKVRIWESSRCHRETRSTLALSIGAIAIATAQLPLYLWSIY